MELVLRAANDPTACAVAIWLNNPKLYYNEHHNLYRQIRVGLENKRYFKFILKSYHVESTRLSLPPNISFNELKTIAKHYSSQIMISDVNSPLYQCYVGLTYDTGLGTVNLYVKSASSWCCLL